MRSILAQRQMLFVQANFKDILLQTAVNSLHEKPDKQNSLFQRVGNDGVRTFNFSNQISVWSADTDKHVLIALAELVNTYQNTEEMIKKNSLPKNYSLVSQMPRLTRAQIKD